MEIFILLGAGILLAFLFNRLDKWKKRRLGNGCHLKIVK